MHEQKSSYGEIMKIQIVVLIAFLGGCAFAQNCAMCSNTSGLRDYQGGKYCYKHYCVRHKVPKGYSEECVQCELSKDIARRKGKCAVCGTRKGLSVVRTEYTQYPTDKDYEKYTLACANHFCVKHTFVYTQNLLETNYSCSVCSVEQKEAKLQETEAFFRKLKADKAKALNEKERILEQPLDSFLGIRLGCDASCIVNLESGRKYYGFEPHKPFRNFKKYSIYVEEGRVVAVRAAMRFDYLRDAEEEFKRVMSVLDMKYGALRRSEVIRRRYDCSHCFYDFERKNKESAKQTIYLGYARVEGSISDYELSIDASIVDQLRRSVEKDLKSDAEAL